MADAFSDFMEDELVTGIFRTNDVGVWTASTTYAVGDKVVGLATSSPRVYVCTASGNSGGSEPAWNTTFGATTVDNAASWVTCQIGGVKYPFEVALFTSTATLSELESGNLTNEVASANAYARVTYGPDDTNWTVSANGTTDNAQEIVFPTASGGAWGTIRYIALIGPNEQPIIVGQLTLDKIVDDGDTFKFNVGDFDLTIS